MAVVSEDFEYEGTEGKIVMSVEVKASNNKLEDNYEQV